MKKLYIIGAGGFGREVAWLVERINEKAPTWDLQGFIDDNEEIGRVFMPGHDFYIAILFSFSSSFLFSSSIKSRFAISAFR